MLPVLESWGKRSVLPPILKILPFVLPFLGTLEKFLCPLFARETCRAHANTRKPRRKREEEIGRKGKSRRIGYKQASVVPHPGSGVVRVLSKVGLRGIGKGRWASDFSPV